jgi:hypothetical protein
MTTVPSLTFTDVPTEALPSQTRTGAGRKKELNPFTDAVNSLTIGGAGKSFTIPAPDDKTVAKIRRQLSDAGSERGEPATIRLVVSEPDKKGFVTVTFNAVPKIVRAAAKKG